MPNPTEPAATDADLLRDWLRGRDLPCPLCRYNLRDLSTDRCPECGQQLRLGLSLAEPFLKAWVSLLVALLLPAGFGILLLLALGYAVAHEGLADIVRNTSDVSPGPLLVFLHLIACVPGSVLTVMFRRQFLRLRRATQSAVAVLAWAAVAGSLGYILLHTLL